MSGPGRSARKSMWYRRFGGKPPQPAGIFKVSSADQKDARRWCASTVTAPEREPITVQPESACITSYPCCICVKPCFFPCSQQSRTVGHTGSHQIPRRVIGDGSGARISLTAPSDRAHVVLHCAAAAQPGVFSGDQCRRMGAATRKTLGRLLRRGRTIRAPAPGGPSKRVRQCLTPV